MVIRVKDGRNSEVREKIMMPFDGRDKAHIKTNDARAILYLDRKKYRENHFQNNERKKEKKT